MTNAEIKDLRARVEAGDLLSREEQLDLLQQLFRANRRIQEARRAGFPTEPSRRNGADGLSPDAAD